MHSDKAPGYSVVRLFIHENNNWLEIQNNTCFWQVHTRDVSKDLTPKDQDKDKDLTPKDKDLTPKDQDKDHG